MKTVYKTSKAPYIDIHFGDVVERYEGDGHLKIVWWFGVKMWDGKTMPFPMLKVDKVILSKHGNKG